MLDKNASAKALKRQFRRFCLVDLNALYETLKTRSRMSVFRRLLQLGYLTSFTHRGRYYTMSDIPQFDQYGLWFHQGVGFSRVGTLKSTIVKLIEDSVAGLTHRELELLVRIRVHNSLLALVRDKRIGRERVEGAFLYVNSDPDQAEQQIVRRQKQLADECEHPVGLPASTIIEVLVEALQAGVVPVLVARQLTARGVSVSIEQVKQVFGQYGIETGKKTPG
jgi:hypothetical protein